MTRTPLALAALASAAVPGLDPVTVRDVEQRPGHQFEVAFLEDTQRRRWVVRAPVSAAAGAQMDLAVSLLGLLSRRLPFLVPTPKGFVTLKEGGRAAIYPYISGHPLNFAHLPGGPGIAAELGRALAALHNVDLALCDEAGLTSYDPDTYRTRRLSDLDRAAATGHVPPGLLSRWEQALEEVSLWRFAPTATHGDLTGDEVLVVFDDKEDAATGHVRGLTGWQNAKVADPADDFATLVTRAPPAAVDSVLEAYALARVDRPDKYLRRRARLAGELKLVSELLTAVGAGDRRGIKACAQRLRHLDAGDFDEMDDEAVVPTAPTTQSPDGWQPDREHIPAGSSPAGSSPAGSSPAGSSPAGSSPAGSSPAGSSPAGSSPAGSSPAGSSSAGSSSAGSSSAGSSSAGSSSAGSTPAGEPSRSERAV